MVRTFASEDSECERTHPLMQRGELASKARMNIRSKEYIVDQSERDNSHCDRRAPVDAGQENVLG